MSERYAALESGAKRSLDWLNHRLNAFSPVEGSDDFALKAFAELALVYAYLEGWEQLALRQHLPRWRAFVIEQCEKPALCSCRGSAGPLR
jgi:hypothetical protein